MSEFFPIEDSILGMDAPEHTRIRRTGRTVTVDATFASISHPREHCAMGDKSPKKSDAKKPSKSLKEKRAAKDKKRRDGGAFGAG